MNRPSEFGNPPVVPYSEAVANFRPEDIAAALHGSLEDGINACVECCDRHVAPGHVALEWESQDGRRASYTFAQLKELSARFAGFLKSRGVQPGDVVAGMLPRTPELLVTILGTWRAGAVYQPLFTAFGPKAVEHRLKTSAAKLVVTDPANRPKLDDIKEAPAIAVVTRSDIGEAVRAGDFDFHAELAGQNADFEPVLRRGSDLFMMMSTSGTTGLPKGVPVPLKALLSFYVYMRDAVGLVPDDKFWNIADPGWAYGLYYAVTGPLLLGNATTFYDGAFTVESTYRIIENHGITNLAGAPTAYRMLIAAGPEAAARVKGKLRAVSSAGEPLNPEVINWFDKHLAAPIHDHYGQTELGMVVNNHHRLSHRCTRFRRLRHAGLPRRRARRRGSRNCRPTCPVCWRSILSIRRYCGSGLWQQETPAIAGGYYRTGDTVELEPDGRISFVGRSDDVITSSGYRIGPFDVESALIEHPPWWRWR